MLASPVPRKGRTPLNLQHQQSVRDRIFEAAEILFAAHGYKSTSVQSIVDCARVNKRMLYHYFGNKKLLYDAVVQRNFSEILDRVVDVSSRDLSDHGPAIALATAVREYFDALLAHPRYVRFILWEEADGWSVLNDLPRRSLDRIRELLTDIVHQGLRDGLFDSKFDPDTVWSYIVGVPSFYFTYRPRLQLYSLENLADLDIVTRFRSEIIRFVLLGLGMPRDIADVTTLAATSIDPTTIDKQWDSSIPELTFVKTGI